MKWRAYQPLHVKSNSGAAGFVDAYVCDQELHTFLILAERHDNTGSSVTNNYEEYAEQACRLIGIDASRTVFLELYRTPAALRTDPGQCEITLDRVRPTPDSWQPVDGGLREVILQTLTSQHALSWSYREPDPWDIPGEQRGRWP